MGNRWQTTSEARGVTPPAITPAPIIEAAIEARLIDQGDLWMRAIGARNPMSHTCDLEAFDRVVTDIRTGYFGLLDHLQRSMRDQDDREASA